VPVNLSADLPVPGPTGEARHDRDDQDDEDRDLVLADLETIPGQPRYW
jgi:hypothetical protein